MTKLTLNKILGKYIMFIIVTKPSATKTHPVEPGSAFICPVLEITSLSMVLLIGLDSSFL